MRIGMEVALGDVTPYTSLFPRMRLEKLGHLVLRQRKRQALSIDYDGPRVVRRVLVGRQVVRLRVLARHADAEIINDGANEWRSRIYSGGKTIRSIETHKMAIPVGWKDAAEWIADGGVSALRCDSARQVPRAVRVCCLGLHLRWREVPPVRRRQIRVPTSCVIGISVHAPRGHKPAAGGGSEVSRRYDGGGRHAPRPLLVASTMLSVTSEINQQSSRRFPMAVLQSPGHPTAPW